MSTELFKGKVGIVTGGGQGIGKVGRVGRPEDIADLAAFPLSDQAGFITGQIFIADGGMTRKMIYIE